MSGARVLLEMNGEAVSLALCFAQRQHEDCSVVSCINSVAAGQLNAIAKRASTKL